MQSDLSRFQSWTRCLNNKYLLNSDSGPGAMSDPENRGFAADSINALVVSLLCDLG